MDDDLDKIILKLKYINNLTISQIAIKIDKSVEWTSRLHTKALIKMLNSKIIQ